MQNETVGTTGKPYGGATGAGTPGVVNGSAPYFTFQPTTGVSANGFELLNSGFNTLIGNMEKVIPGGNKFLFLEACEDLKAAYWKLYGAIAAASAVGNV